jgi:N-acetylglucosaminyldiphosphoundecaprenol N-acetyl-beta-D-mannosaminyltransferase
MAPFRATLGSRRIDVMGAPLDALTMGETVEIIARAMREGGRVHHVALNAAKLVKMRSDPELDADVRAGDLIGADGMSVVWAARALGRPTPERVAGVDLMGEVLAVCARDGFRPYFLGAEAEVVATAARVACQRWPGLVFAGWRDGYFSPAEEEEVVRAIGESRADCLFIALPTPRKERFLARRKHELDVPFVMGVGGSLDVLAGKVSRAPLWAQRAGLEWAHRLLQEPRKMFWRYASTNTRFILLLAAAAAARALGKAPTRRPAAR